MLYLKKKLGIFYICYISKAHLQEFDRHRKAAPVVLGPGNKTQETWAVLLLCPLPGPLSFLLGPRFPRL